MIDCLLIAAHAFMSESDVYAYSWLRKQFKLSEYFFVGCQR